MKLVHEKMSHIISFGTGVVNELVVENKKVFSEMVSDAMTQADGMRGNFVLSVDEKPVEFSKYADVTVQFAPFQMNRKSLLTKLCAALERNAVNAENYIKTVELLSNLEAYIHSLAEDFSFEIGCRKNSISSVVRALAPEIEEVDKSPIEKIFGYMETVRELDSERVFIMVNMRSYFSDEEMNSFIESVCLHDFKMLLIESVEFPKLDNTVRYTIDEDLCEF